MLLLKEYETDPTITWRDSILYRYHRHFQPTSICDLIAPEHSATCDIPLFTYPWGTFALNQADRHRQVWQSRFCGPSTDEFIEAEHDRTIRLYRQIKRDGYTPWRYGCTFISGSFLVDEAGKTRFVVMQGNHRLAALAALGAREVTVRTEPGFLLTHVNAREVDDWQLVRNGRCSRSVALAIFRIYFEQDGEHVRRLVLNAAPSSVTNADL